jgi:hypothetical protein
MLFGSSPILAENNLVYLGPNAFSEELSVRVDKSGSRGSNRRTQERNARGRGKRSGYKHSIDHFCKRLYPQEILCVET